MRFLLSLVFLAGTLCSFAQRDSMMQAFMKTLEEKNKNAIGRPFPRFDVSDGNKNISNESLHGKVVLINFWFEGCHPCLAEFDALNELYGKLKENRNFEFISFTWDDAATIKRVKENFRLQFKVLKVEAKECYRLNLQNGFPTSIILDKQGNIKYLFYGGFPDKEKAREFVMTKLLDSIKREL
jgi:thiol-disulfide isomerase/thioredoxin